MIRVGIVGTGFVAKLRGELFSQFPEVKLVGYAGTPDRVGVLAEQFNCPMFTDARELIATQELDLVVVANVNGDHSRVVRLALEAGKNVVVEYPLALSWQEGKELWELAQSQGKLLHVEHIELLGGVHQTMVHHLPSIGEVNYARYVTKSPQPIAPDKWTYYPDRHGFPLVGALSRIHRLTAVWGEVSKVSCQLHYEGEFLPDRFSSCLCQAQLIFANGVIGDVHFSKGTHCWESARTLEVQGSNGGLFFDGDKGKLVTALGEDVLSVGNARGLFQTDTLQVVRALEEGTPLYTSPESSLRALKVACAAQRSVLTGQTIDLDRLTSP